MVSVYLNKDKSLYADVTDDGIHISSNHTNPKNSRKLVENIKGISRVDRNKKETVVCLGDTPYVRINNKTGKVTSDHLLTSFETRLFAQGKNTEALPFARPNKITKSPKTDLHTHFAAALTPEKLIQAALGKNIMYSKNILEKAHIDTSLLSPQKNGDFLLDDIVSNAQNKQKLVNAMKIDTSEQETFNQMEEIYAARTPITKAPKMFYPMLKAIAQDSKDNGVDYLEFSFSPVISNPDILKELDEYLPAIEKETGVQIRFLGSMWRHSHKEFLEDQVDRLKVVAQSPYVVGCDFMGHETNSTMEFYNDIKELAKYAMLNDPDFVVRVHAGENPLFKANARQVLLAVEEAHYEILNETGKDVQYPQVRIGHGIYGFDEPAPWDENERTKNISMLELCKKIDPIIEFNMSSNLSLNNINSLDEIPIKKYIDQGIRVVLGTDGRGIYSTDIGQEVILARQAGLDDKDINKIIETENQVIARARRRFKKFKKVDYAALNANLENCFRKGSLQCTEEVEKRYSQEHVKLQNELKDLIKGSNANTDLEEIKAATAGKIPVMITGSSKKHWPKVSEENCLAVRVALNTLIHCIDPEKAYLVTGGTNHGVEREAHILADVYNKTADKKLVVLGTLTEEAAHTETNSIEKNTITHAIIPTLDGKPAKRWFDLPDTVLNMVKEQNGCVVAICGGPIVSDIIQRSHNLGLNLEIMSGVEGASGEKSKALAGNGYSFADAAELVEHLLRDNKSVLRPDLSKDKVDGIIKESFEIFAPREEKQEKTAMVDAEKK